MESGYHEGWPWALPPKLEGVTLAADFASYYYAGSQARVCVLQAVCAPPELLVSFGVMQRNGAFRGTQVRSL